MALSYLLLVAGCWLLVTCFWLSAFTARYQRPVASKKWDCAYPGVEILPEGTFVLTTYGHWIQGKEPFIVSVRLKLEELDAYEQERSY